MDVDSRADLAGDELEDAKVLADNNRNQGNIKE